ncbi:LOW QUALITY PROTEIN: hypothetical protein MXB_4843 [Myxobolus squamalis]|nr:LOW QUALITY PROTEIN: hypothetical protein MXB_4843 [Myxobolus squamalis]
MEDEVFKRRSFRQSQYLERRRSIESRDPNKINEPWKRDKFEQNLTKSLSMDSLVPTPRNVDFDVDLKPQKRKFSEQENENSKPFTPLSIPPTNLDPIRFVKPFYLKSWYYQVASDLLIGCVSWSWYYPFHYSPFASDCNLVQSIDVDWPKTFNPFRPFEQLMSVLPESSKYLLPVCYHDLITSHESPIIDFYPNNFVIDLNGKFQEWQGVALLPFIDETRLLTFMTLNLKLSPEEGTKILLKRELLNSIGDNYLLLRESHNLGEAILANAPLLGLGAYVGISDLNYANLCGEVLELKSAQRSSQGVASLNEEDNIKISSPVVVVKFRDPVYPDNTIFLSKLLNGSKIPKPILKPTNYPRHQPYTPILNFPESATQPVCLTLPARRHFQYLRLINSRHAMPHPSSSGYHQESYTSHPHRQSGGRNSPEYRQRFNSRDDPRMNEYRSSDPRIIDYHHNNPRVDDYRRDDRPFRPHYSNDSHSRRPSSYYNEESHDPRNHRYDNLPSNKRQTSRRYGYDR